MTQRSLHWDGASQGDAQLLTVTAADGIGYRLANKSYESPFVDRMFRALWNGTDNRGVLQGWANELAVTAPGAVSPIQIDTGAAIVYGLYYENTAAVNKVVATPTNDTRYDLVVVRRNWTAQTARIYVITGTEGGGIPGVTQSPAPSGSGIYDIPLASIEVTTGGAITVTDAREYCTFSTGYADNSVGTTQMTDASVAFADRATRTKLLFLGGSDLEPNVNAGRFAYLIWTSYLTQVGPPTWNGAANEEAWRTTGAVTSQYRGLYGTFRVPADHVPGTAMTSYVWFVNNAVVAASFSIITAAQFWAVSTIRSNPGCLSTYTTTSISATGAVSDVLRVAGCTLTPTTVAVSTNDIIHYYVAFYNTAGTEDIGVMGVEIRYTGYT
jgi:hypothetical protein